MQVPSYVDCNSEGKLIGRPFQDSNANYRIGANTTALLIITASRVNSNIKAPKLLNLKNTTAS